MRGLFIGRLQPPHNGHLHVIKSALRECDELIIGIGSAEQSFTAENPFTAGERHEMLRNALNAEKLLHRCIIVPIRDIHRYDVWVSHVESLVPHFDVVYTGEEREKMLFEYSGYRVRNVEVTNPNCRGIVIRNIIRNNGWDKRFIDYLSIRLKEFLPDEIIKFIKAIKRC